MGDHGEEVKAEVAPGELRAGSLAFAPGKRKRVSTSSHLPMITKSQPSRAWAIQRPKRRAKCVRHITG